ncbi:Hypothetical predicted protein [Octopus vulgaris]|uniref:Uncharacterized protein n=1 Tax=Octopus vulgaris TaxID=6645 RepID=A0AA36AGX5_OCTVU|nr:Hypothetical predicted protein [Octopus vulgaris]
MRQGSNYEKRILIFASNEGLQQLENTSFLGMDGTFKSSPSASYQLFTIHTILNDSSSYHVRLSPDSIMTKTTIQRATGTDLTMGENIKVMLV